MDYDRLFFLSMKLIRHYKQLRKSHTKNRGEIISQTLLAIFRESDCILEDDDTPLLRKHKEQKLAEFAHALFSSSTKNISAVALLQAFQEISGTNLDCLFSNSAVWQAKVNENQNHEKELEKIKSLLERCAVIFQNVIFVEKSISIKLIRLRARVLAAIREIIPN